MLSKGTSGGVSQPVETIKLAYSPVRLRSSSVCAKTSSGVNILNTPTGTDSPSPIHPKGTRGERQAYPLYYRNDILGHR